MRRDLRWKSTSYDPILADENGTLQAGADINASGLAEVFIVLIVRHSPPRPPRTNCTSRLSCHLKVLVFFVLLPRRQANYDSILVVVDRLKKMLRNEPVQITIDAPRLLQLDHQRLKLSLHLQVLVPAVPLAGSAEVTRLRVHRTYFPRGRPHPPFQIQVGIS